MRVFRAFTQTKELEQGSPPDASMNMKIHSGDCAPGSQLLWSCGPGEAEGVRVQSDYYHAVPNESLLLSEAVYMQDDLLSVPLVSVEKSGGDQTELVVTVHLRETPPRERARHDAALSTHLHLRRGRADGARRKYPCARPTREPRALRRAGAGPVLTALSGRDHLDRHAHARARGHDLRDGPRTWSTSTSTCARPTRPSATACTRVPRPRCRRRSSSSWSAPSPISCSRTREDAL